MIAEKCRRLDIGDVSVFSFRHRAINQTRAVQVSRPYGQMNFDHA